MKSNLHYKKLKEKKFKIVDNESGYDKHVILKTFELPNGMTESFFVDDNKNSVQIFAMTGDEQVLCVRQFRPGHEHVQLELPGGGLDGEENPKVAAAREMLEETGFSGDEPVFLAALDYSPYSTGKRYMFMCLGCQQTQKLNLNPNEFLEVVLVPVEQFRKLMLEGKVRGHDTAYMALDRLKRLGF